eukprot:gene4223-7560_t
MSLFVLLGGTFIIQSYMQKKIEKEEEIKSMEQKAIEQQKVKYV